MLPDAQSIQLLFFQQDWPDFESTEKGCVPPAQKNTLSYFVPQVLGYRSAVVVAIISQIKPIRKWDIARHYFVSRIWVTSIGSGGPSSYNYC